MYVPTQSIPRSLVTYVRDNSTCGCRSAATCLSYLFWKGVRVGGLVAGWAVRRWREMAGGERRGRREREGEREAHVTTKKKKGTEEEGTHTDLQIYMFTQVATGNERASMVGSESLLLCNFVEGMKMEQGTPAASSWRTRSCIACMCVCTLVRTVSHYITLHRQVLIRKPVVGFGNGSKSIDACAHTSPSVSCLVQRQLIPPNQLLTVKIEVRIASYSSVVSDLSGRTYKGMYSTVL